MSIPLASLGTAALGAGGIGGGLGSTSIPPNMSSAESAIRTAVGEQEWSSGAGNRAFQNFVTFSGGKMSIDAESSSTGLNPPIFPASIQRIGMWALIVLFLVLFGTFAIGLMKKT